MAIAVGGQVVVGDQHLQAQFARGGDALEAGNAVVHGDQHVSAAVFHPLRDGGGQAVAIHHPVRHDVVHVLGAEQAQAAHAHGAGGGAVAVVVRHDAELLVGCNGIGQQHGSSGGAEHVGGGNQAGQTVVEIVGVLHPARGVQLGQQRVNTGLLQGPGCAGGDVSYYYFHSALRRGDEG